MKTYEIDISNFSKDFINSLKYQLSYLCSDIVKVEETESRVTVYYNDSFGDMKGRINNIMDTLDTRLNNIAPDEIYKNVGENENNDNVIGELSATGEIVIYDKGLIGFGGRFLELYTKLDNMFHNWGLELGALDYQYPDLISLDTLSQYNYLSQFPQHLIFAPHLKENISLINTFSRKVKLSRDVISSDYIDVEGVRYANKLAVCPHVYKQYEGKTIDPCNPVIISSVGKCKRYESVNVNYFERLLDFSMREIVVIGSPEYILEVRERLMEKTRRFIEKMGLTANIRTATDPFFTAEYSPKLLLQQKFKLKYELNMELPRGKELSVGSFNYHGSHFIEDFNIKSASDQSLATGCIAFGVERFVYAIMVQKGLNAQFIMEE